MITLNDKNLCECCFEEIPAGSKKCRCCSGPDNLLKYPTSLKEGEILLGRYVVGHVLGKGGFGITYLSYDSQLSKKVAIKEYLPNSLTFRTAGTTLVSTYGGESEDYFRQGAQKFFDEAKLVSRFNGNPNIISVYEFFVDNNTAYYVMEFLEGVDLKNYVSLKGGKISEQEAMTVATRMADALMIVHSQGTLHRDIAPDNIFVLRDGSVKLIDFGAARQVLGEASKSMSVILKQGFAPMEQYQKKGKQGPWTDIYALGATIYYALTGLVIDDAMSRFEDETLELDGVDPKFKAVLEKMLRVKAGDRYQNAFELKQALMDTGIEPVPLEFVEMPKNPVCERCGAEIDEGETLCEKCKAETATKAKKAKKENKKTRDGGENVIGETKKANSILQFIPLLIAAIPLLCAVILLVCDPSFVKVASVLWIIAIVLGVAAVIWLVIMTVKSKKTAGYIATAVAVLLMVAGVVVLALSSKTVDRQYAKYFLANGDHASATEYFLKAQDREAAKSSSAAAGCFLDLNKGDSEKIITAPGVAHIYYTPLDGTNSSVRYQIEKNNIVRLFFEANASGYSAMKIYLTDDNGNILGESVFVVYK